MAIVCGQCGHNNPTHLRVCARCAAPLANLCPACGFENPAGFKFCGNCGVNLLASALPQSMASDALRRMQSHVPSDLVEKILRVSKQLEGERRNVTILFTDVVGFTSLSEQLDPEQVFAIIEQVQKAFLDEIYTHEGWFDKFLGDGLMAIFGAPVAHEDDPARAVRAALGMQNALKRINEELDPRLNLTLRIRIGLNAGTVVVATLGSDMKLNYTPLGDAVNVASRLQTLAEAGTVVVSRAVYEQTKPLFEFVELGSIRVKGRLEPVEIFQAVGPKRAPGRARGIPGLNAPMIGRDQEFAQLKGVIGEWLRRADSRLVLVTGEAGIGKSRMTSELKQQLIADEATRVETACLAYGQTSYEVFRRLLRSLFQITSDDDDWTAGERIRQHLMGVLGDHTPLNRVLPYVQYLLSIPVVEPEMADRIRYLEPAQLRQQIFLAVRDFLLAQSRCHPLLLIFEDLHWIDKPSLDLLLFLLNAIESAPILIYGTSRPAEGQAISQLDQIGRTAFGARFLRLDLDSLSPFESTALVDQLLTISTLPVELKQMIRQRGEGNPFYLEEIIRMLIDRGIVRRAGRGWEMTPGMDLTTLEVPSTLQGLIMARVDNLEMEAREALQTAAVIGRSFSKRLLHDVLAEEDSALEADLQELRDHELVAPLNQTPELEFTFRHVLIQETVYASLLHRRRERLHHKIAEAIEALYADHLDDYIEQLAFHYQESHDPVRALPYLIRAGERATSRYANDEALRFYQAALDVLSNTAVSAEQRIAVYRGLGDVQNVVGNYDGAMQSYRNALEITRSLTEAPARQIADLIRKLGRVFERKGQYDEALRWLDTALDELDRDPDSLRAVERMRVYHEMGWVYYRRGELDKAYQWRMRSLEIGAGSDYYAEMGSAYNGLVPIFSERGDWARARAYAEEGLRLREKIGDMEGTALCYLNLGNIAALQGEWSKAIEYNERGLELAQRIGKASTILPTLNSLGYIYTLKGDGARAREYLGKALSVAERSGDAHQICATLNNLVQVALLEGDLHEALITLERSLARATETGSKTDLAQTYWLLALTHLAREDMQSAENFAQRSLSIAEEAKLRRSEGRACCALGCVHRAQGRLAEAQTLFERAMQIFQKLNNPLELARTQMEIARLALLRNDTVSMNREAQQALQTFVRLGAEADRRHALVLLRELVA